MYTAYAVFTTWTHSKNGISYRDRIAINLDADQARAYTDRPDTQVAAYLTAPFVALDRLNQREYLDVTADLRSDEPSATLAARHHSLLMGA